MPRWTMYKPTVAAAPLLSAEMSTVVRSIMASPNAASGPYWPPCRLLFSATQAPSESHVVNA